MRRADVKAAQRHAREVTARAAGFDGDHGARDGRSQQRSIGKTHDRRAVDHDDIKLGAGLTKQHLHARTGQEFGRVWR